jgi:hypothetical protein
MLKYIASINNYYVELMVVFLTDNEFFLTILIYLTPAGDLYKLAE